MKYNKKLLLILFISLVSLAGTIFIFTFFNKELPKDNDTPANDNVQDSSKPGDDVKDDETSNDDSSDKDDEASNDDKNDESDTDQDNNTDDDSNQDTSGDSNSDNTPPDNGNMEMNKEGIYAVSNNYFKSISPLDEKSVLKAANYINSLKENYLTENNKVFYAVIPDKTYYDKVSSYDKLDYDKMVDILNENIEGIEYIALKDLLSIDDYYKIDNHWKQENIIDIANRIGEKLDFKISSDSFEKNSYSGLNGMYSKYAVDSSYKEELYYLTNDHTANAVVDNYQNKSFTKIYDTNRLSTDVSYDIFLSGATPFLTISNSSANSEKELVIFRDSYTSSLAPLLIGEYKKITLIDTRYMANTLIKDFIEFTNQDILFLYSSAILNNSTMLK